MNKWQPRHSRNFLESSISLFHHFILPIALQNIKRSLLDRRCSSYSLQDLLSLKSITMSEGDSSAPTIQSLIAIGLPAALVNIVLPKALAFLRHYPRVTKVLTYILALISTAGAFTWGVKPLFEKFIWKWLPIVELEPRQALHRALIQHVEPFASPTVLNKISASAEYKGRSSIYDEDETKSLNSNSNNGSPSTEQQDQRSDITYNIHSSKIFWRNGTTIL